VGLTINTVPLTHSTRFGGLPGSYPFLIRLHIPLPLSPSFTGFPDPGHRAYCALLLLHDSSCVQVFECGRDNDPLGERKNCTVSQNRVLVLVGLGLNCQEPVAWLLHSFHLGFGTEPFFARQTGFRSTTETHTIRESTLPLETLLFHPRSRLISYLQSSNSPKMVYDRPAVLCGDAETRSTM
jgi:hypothetical protein